MIDLADSKMSPVVLDPDSDALNRFFLFSFPREKLTDILINISIYAGPREQIFQHRAKF